MDLLISIITIAGVLLGLTFGYFMSDWMRRENLRIEIGHYRDAIQGERDDLDGRRRALAERADILNEREASLRAAEERLTSRIQQWERSRAARYEAGVVVSQSPTEPDRYRINGQNDAMIRERAARRAPDRVTVEAEDYAQVRALFGRAPDPEHDARVRERLALAVDRPALADAGLLQFDEAELAMLRLAGHFKDVPSAPPPPAPESGIVRKGRPLLNIPAEDL